MYKMISALILAWVSSQSYAVVPGDVAPSWVGTDLKTNAQISFPAQLQGKPAVLIFWATWCPYCKAFMPYAKQIQADYAHAGVQLITFNHKERGRGDPRSYVKSLDIPMVAIANADEIGDLYDIPFIPGLLVVGGDGVIVYRRRSTELPAGETVSQLWDREVRAVLDTLTSG